MRVSNTIRNDIEQVIEDEKRDDAGRQTGGDRGRSKSSQEEQLQWNRADAQERHDFGRNPYYFSCRHDKIPDVISVHPRRRIWHLLYNITPL